MVIHVIQNFKSPPSKANYCHGWHYCETGLTIDEFNQAQNLVIKAVQQDVYAEEINCVQKHEKLPKTSPLKNVEHYLDENRLLRVGGHIRDSNISQREKNPLIVPGPYVASLLIKHFHKQIQHKDRLFTQRAVHSAESWIEGGKRKVSTIIHH